MTTSDGLARKYVPSGTSSTRPANAQRAQEIVFQIANNPNANLASAYIFNAEDLRIVIRTAIALGQIGAATTALKLNEQSSIDPEYNLQEVIDMPVDFTPVFERLDAHRQELQGLLKGQHVEIKDELKGIDTRLRDVETNTHLILNGKIPEIKDLIGTSIADGKDKRTNRLSIVAIVISGLAALGTIIVPLIVPLLSSKTP